MEKLSAQFSLDKEVDNIETIDGLNETITEWVNSLTLPFEPDLDEVENFEFRSCSGFHAHDYNRGGVDLIAITSISSLIGSGEHLGLSIEDQVDYAWESAKKDLMKHADFVNVDPNSDKFFDALYEYCSDDYSMIAWRVRVMYKGNGVLSIYAGYDDDAPYFRWDKKANFERQITFKTISGLKRQLKALTSQVEKTK